MRQCRTQPLLSGRVRQKAIARASLAALYFALRDRENKPLLDTFLGFDMNPTVSSQWQKQLEADDDEVLERLGLVKDGAPVGWVETIEPAQALGALRKAVGDMRAAAHHRTVAGGVMVKSFNKLKHGSRCSCAR